MHERTHVHYAMRGRYCKRNSARNIISALIVVYMPLYIGRFICPNTDGCFYGLAALCCRQNNAA